MLLVDMLGLTHEISDRLIGRNKPHRGDRKWVNGWSPEQIANRLQVDFPDDPSMRISHEAIYQALYIQGRGALKRPLRQTSCRLPFHADDPRQSDTTCKRINIRQSS
jgi:IS30 family transposase